MSRPPARTPAPRSPRRGPGGTARSGTGRSGTGRSGGTASKRSRPAGTARGAALAAKHASRSVRRWAILASIMVVLAVLLLPTLRNYLHQRGEIAALRDHLAEQRADVAELQREQARWRDNAYVEQQARERLKFVMPGDKAYTVIDATPSVPDQLGIAHLSQDTRTHPWYGQLWESAKVADRATSAP